MDMARKLVSKLKQKQHRRSISDLGPSTQFGTDYRPNEEREGFKIRVTHTFTLQLSRSSGDVSSDGEMVKRQVSRPRRLSWSMSDSQQTQNRVRYINVDWKTAAEIAEGESNMYEDDSDSVDGFLSSSIWFSFPWSNADRPGRRPRRPPTKPTLFNGELWERKKHFRQLNEVTPVAVERELFRRLSRYESD